MEWKELPQADKSAGRAASVGLLMPDGSIVVGHFAYGDGDGLIPPFRGWFRKAGDGFLQIQPLKWAAIDDCIRYERERGELLGPLIGKYGATAVVRALGVLRVASDLGAIDCDDEAESLACYFCGDEFTADVDGVDNGGSLPQCAYCHYSEFGYFPPGMTPADWTGEEESDE